MSFCSLYLLKLSDILYPYIEFDELLLEEEVAGSETEVNIKSAPKPPIEVLFNVGNEQW